jgi:putative tricarboxylic transport membrane protein
VRDGNAPGIPGRADRISGACLMVLGLAVGAEASTFEVAFLTDPVGPKALPYLSAAIFFGAGVLLLARPGPPPIWPGRRVLARMAGATAAFLLYGLVLRPLGFTVATTLAVGTLSTLFGGPVRRSFAAALALSVVLWYLFVWVLGLPLPLGALWTR